MAWQVLASFETYWILLVNKVQVEERRFRNNNQGLFKGKLFYKKIILPLMKLLILVTITKIFTNIATQYRVLVKVLGGRWLPWAAGAQGQRMGGVFGVGRCHVAPERNRIGRIEHIALSTKQIALPRLCMCHGLFLHLLFVSVFLKKKKKYEIE